MVAKTRVRHLGHEITFQCLFTSLLHSLYSSPNPTNPSPTTHHVEKRKAELAMLEAKYAPSIHKKQQTRIARGTIITGSDIKTQTTVLPLDPQPLRTLPAPPCAAEPQTVLVEESSKSKTQVLRFAILIYPHAPNGLCRLLSNWGNLKMPYLSCWS